MKEYIDCHIWKIQRDLLSDSVAKNDIHITLLKLIIFTFETSKLLKASLADPLIQIKCMSLMSVYAGWAGSFC